MELDLIIDRIKSEVKRQMLLRDLAQVAPINNLANAIPASFYNKTLHQEGIKALEILGEWQRDSVTSISDLNQE